MAGARFAPNGPPSVCCTLQTSQNIHRAPLDGARGTPAWPSPRRRRPPHCPATATPATTLSAERHARAHQQRQHLCRCVQTNRQLPHRCAGPVAPTGCEPHARLPAAAPAGHLSHSPHGFSALHRPDVTFSCGGLLYPVHSMLLAGARRLRSGGHVNAACLPPLASLRCCTTAQLQPSPQPCAPLQSPAASLPSSSPTSRWAAGWSGC